MWRQQSSSIKVYWNYKEFLICYLFKRRLGVFVLFRFKFCCLQKYHRKATNVWQNLRYILCIQPMNYLSLGNKLCSSQSREETIFFPNTTLAKDSCRQHSVIYTFLHNMQKLRYVSYFTSLLPMFRKDPFLLMTLSMAAGKLKLKMLE